VVLVTGRVDHKEAGSTCVIAQTVQRFAPSAQEIERAGAQAEAEAQSAIAHARPLHLRVDAAAIANGAIEERKAAIEDCPGSAEVLLDVHTSAGTRRLKFGAAYRVAHTATLRAELEHALAPFASAATG
jgi:hypothetical protein